MAFCGMNVGRLTELITEQMTMENWVQILKSQINDVAKTDRIK